MNKKIVFILLTLCICASKNQAQESPQSNLVFDKLVHDFGDFLISDGKKSCTFTYTNKGNTPIIIQHVIATCGCTEPKWNKAPIMPGAKGTITVTYSNDQGPYPFDKVISVYSTANTAAPTVLRIRGVVHEKKKSVAELFPIEFGSLRLKATLFHLGQIDQGEAKTDSVQIVNGSKNSIEVGFKNVGKGLVIRVRPQKLKPGERGTLIYTVDTRIHEDWGAVVYTAQPTVNGKVERATPFEISADIRDNFKRYSQEQLANAPILLSEQTSFRVENVKKGTKIEKDFVIINKGKSPIVLHKATIPNDYTFVSMPKEIAAGKSANITISVDSNKLNGDFVTGVTFITNVPSRPIFALLISGTIVSQ